MRILIWGLIVILLFTTVACTHKSANCAYLSSKGYYCLQPTTAITPFDVQQKIELTFNDVHEVMITEIEVDNQSLHFVSLTPLGQKLFHIRYDNHQTKVIYAVTKMAEPALLMAMLQLTLWPISSLHDGLSESLKLEEENSHRRIFDGDTLILDVHYIDAKKPHQKMRITMPKNKFLLDIETLTIPPEPSNG